MPYAVRYNADLGIIEAALSGTYTAEHARRLIGEAVELMRAHSCTRILTDVRRASIEISTMDLYDAPPTVARAFALTDIPLSSIRRAVVARPDQLDAKFLENVLANRRHVMQVFPTVEAALAWLLA